MLMKLYDLEYAAHARHKRAAEWHTNRGNCASYDSIRDLLIPLPRYNIFKLAINIILRCFLRVYRIVEYDYAFS